MKAELLHVDSPRWQEAINQLPHDAFHLPAFTKASERVDGGDALAFIFDEEPGGAFLAPMILRTLGNCLLGNRLRSDVVSPYGYSGPLCRSDHPGFLARAVSAFVSRMRSAGVVSGFFRLHPLLPLDRAILANHGDVMLVGDTVWIDLTCTEAELWRQTRENHRRDIRRAEQEGFTARVDPDGDALPEFSRAYRETMSRVGAHPYYLFDDGYFCELRARMAGTLTLLVVERAGEVAAAALFTECGGIAQYYLGGTVSEWLSHSPMKLMFHFARTWFRERGNRLLHLGGGVGALHDPLFHFKSGFGDGRAQYHTWRVIFDREAYSGLVAAWEQRHQCKVPAGFFPAYRTPAP